MPHPKNSHFCESDGASSPEKTRRYFILRNYLVAIPAALGLPAMLFSIPPLMVLIPATLPFGVQVPAAIFCFPAVVAMVANGPVQSRFGVLHGVLTPGAIIGVCNWYRNEPRKCRHYYCCYRSFSQSLNQSLLLCVSHSIS